MITGLPIGEAQLVAIFVQAIVYGIYLSTAGRCAHVLLFTERGVKKPCHLLCVAAAMLVVITINIIVCFVYIWDTAFRWSPGPDGGFEDKSSKILDVIQV